MLFFYARKENFILSVRWLCTTLCDHTFSDASCILEGNGFLLLGKSSQDEAPCWPRLYSGGIVHMRWLRRDIPSHESARPFFWYCISSPYSNRIWGHRGRCVVLPLRCSPSRCTLCILPQSSPPAFWGWSLSSAVWNSIWAFYKGGNGW